MKTLGIDLASQAGSTAIAEIEWPDEGSPTLTPFEALEVEAITDDRLEALLLSDEWGRIAIDVPFGWPREMVGVLERWRRGDPVEIREESKVRPEILYRQTDRLVLEETGLRPIAVGVNTLAWVALRALHALSAAGVYRDRAGFRSHVIETYPKAALTRWPGMPTSSTKVVEGSSATREQVVDRVVAELDLSMDPENRDKLIDSESDHRFDALICALVARTAMLGRTELPDPDRRSAAEEEGWIHLPIVGSSLSGLASPEFLEVELADRFALETLEPSGEWLIDGEYRAKLFERLPNGTYVCGGHGGSPTWIRCVRRDGEQLHVIDGSGRPFIYRLLPL